MRCERLSGEQKVGDERERYGITTAATVVRDWIFRIRLQVQVPVRFLGFGFPQRIGY